MSSPTKEPLLARVVKIILWLVIIYFSLLIVIGVVHFISTQN